MLNVRRRSDASLMALLAAMWLAQGAALSMADVTVGANVPASVAVERIDHVTWDRLLKKHVDGGGMVDYRAWHGSQTDQRALDSYLRHLSAASIRSDSNRDAKLAFWINAYNAVTVRGILREYPTDSIRNHTAKIFGYNIWEDLYLYVGGKKYSLEQIEHEILRKMGEPRVHFAIVCASIGCPRLLNEAYTPQRLNRQLTANTNAFFADTSKFRFDTSQRTISVSPILDWFAEDFGDSQAKRMRYIAPYLPDESARKLAGSGNATVKYLDYDWGLNEQAKVRR